MNVGRRYRTIKPQIVEDEKVGPLSDAAFRLFASLIVLADDHGNTRGSPRWLQMQIWWAHDKPPNALALLTELHRAGLITPYVVRGESYVHVCGWAKHQRIDNAGKPDVPGPDLADDTSAGHGAGRGITDVEPPAANGVRMDARAADTGVGCASGSVRGESRRVAASRGSDLDQEGKGREGARVRARSPKGTPLPARWEPDDGARGIAQELGLELDREAELFRKHYVSTGENRADWDAAFAKWLLKSRDLTRPRKARDEPREIRDL